MKAVDKHILLMIVFDTLAHPVSSGTGKLLSYLVNRILEADFWDALRYLSEAFV